MFRILRSIRNFATQQTPNRKMINQMADKIQSMKQSMNKTSPRSLSLLLILSTLPTFYFAYQVITSDYSSEQFSSGTQNCVKYLYAQNLAFFSCGLTLWNINFINPTSQFTIHRKISLKRYFPLILSIIGLFLPPIDSKWIAVPAFANQVFITVAQAYLTNEGVLPFWYYSFRHYIRFFNMFVLVLLFVAMQNMQKRMVSHPHEFVEKQSEQNNISKKISEL